MLYINNIANTSQIKIVREARNGGTYSQSQLLRNLRQEDGKFKASLAIPHLKKKKKKIYTSG
jgi:hypothetical protein